MNKLNRQLGRREFLKKPMQSAAVGAVFVGGTSEVAAKDEKSDPADAILSRVLGKTVSRRAGDQTKIELLQN